MAVAQDLAILKAVVRRILAPHDVAVYLFGSQATGRARVKSDIDLALEPGSRCPDQVVGDFRQAVENSNIVRRVDVLDSRDADAAFRRRVRREGKLWTGAKKN